MACLVSLGTNYLLGEDLHGVSTGFIVQTVLHIEGMSGDNLVVVNNSFDHNSKLRDLLLGRWPTGTCEILPQKELLHMFKGIKQK